MPIFKFSKVTPSIKNSLNSVLVYIIVSKVVLTFNMQTFRAGDR